MMQWCPFFRRRKQSIAYGEPLLTLNNGLTPKRREDVLETTREEPEVLSKLDITEYNAFGSLHLTRLSNEERHFSWQVRTAIEIESMNPLILTAIEKEESMVEKKEEVDHEWMDGKEDEDEMHTALECMVGEEREVLFMKTALEYADIGFESGLIDGEMKEEMSKSISEMRNDSDENGKEKEESILSKEKNERKGTGIVLISKPSNECVDVSSSIHSLSLDPPLLTSSFPPGLKITFPRAPSFISLDLEWVDAKEDEDEMHTALECMVGEEREKLFMKTALEYTAKGLERGIIDGEMKEEMSKSISEMRNDSDENGKEKEESILSKEKNPPRLKIKYPRSCVFNLIFQLPQYAMMSIESVVNSTTCTTPRVHFVNGSFVVYEKVDAGVLCDRYRILSDFGSSMEQLGPSSSNSCYSYLMPEQVAIALDNGFINLLHLMRPITTGNDEFVMPSGVEQPELESLELARKIAVGRKMKNLKRKAEGDGTVLAKKLRPDDIVVTTEELNAAMTEVSAPSHDRQSVKIRTNASSELAYESIAFPQEFDTLEFRIRKVVFRDLWSRGFFVTSGVRFGCHFLVYKNLPGTAHAEFMIRCVDSEADQTSTAMLSFARTANQVCKKSLLAIVGGSIHPQYLALQSFTPLLSQDCTDGELIRQ